MCMWLLNKGVPKAEIETWWRSYLTRGFGCAQWMSLSSYIQPPRHSHLTGLLTGAPLIRLPLQWRMTRGRTEVSLSQRETKGYMHPYCMPGTLGEGWESNHYGSVAYKHLTHCPTQPDGGKEDFDSTDGIGSRFTVRKRRSCYLVGRVLGVSST